MVVNTIINSVLDSGIGYKDGWQDRLQRQRV